MRKRKKGTGESLHVQDHFMENNTHTCICEYTKKGNNQIQRKNLVCDCNALIYY